jgi:hypothetical protein
MKTIYFHIGTPKTGTTSLQWSLLNSRKKLEAAGVLFPSSGLSTNPNQFAHHQLFEATKNRDKSLWRDVIAEIKNSKQSVAVISSENFSLLKKEDIAFIRSHIKSHIKCKLVVYLREQCEYLESLYNQAVKTGLEKRDRLEFMKYFIVSGRGNYHALIKSWETLIEPTDLIVRPYRRKNFQGGDILTDFAITLGLDSDILNRGNSELNPSINSIYIEVLRKINHYVTDIEKKNAHVIGWLLKHMTPDEKNYVVYSQTHRAIIKSHYKNSNARLIKKYKFDNEISNLLLRGEEDKNQLVVPEKADVDILTKLLVECNEALS